MVTVFISEVYGDHGLYKNSWMMLSKSWITSQKEWRDHCNFLFMVAILIRYRGSLLLKAVNRICKSRIKTRNLLDEILVASHDRSLLKRML